MADDEKEGDNPSFHGTDWEVVSLTASAYAAAPGPKDFNPPDGSTQEFGANKLETSDATFMSKHFIFPHCEQKNLPLEPDCSEIHNESARQDINPDEELKGSNKSSEANWKVKSDDDPHGIQFFDKEKSLSNHNVEFEEGKALRGLSMIGNEQVIFAASDFSAFHAESDVIQSVLCDESTENCKYDDPSQESLDNEKASNLSNDYKYDGSDLPCEAWWKRQAMSLYNQAKESNSFWSIFVAAALVGLVILGQHWQREKLQVQQLKWQVSINRERMSRMVGPISRLKDVLVGDHQRSQLIRGGAVSNH